MKNKLFSCCLIIVLTSCTSKLEKQDFSADDIVHDFRHYDNHIIKSTKAPKYIHWWRQFLSSELNHLVKEALNHNAKIKQSCANIDIAKAYLQKVQFSWFPTIHMGGTGYRGELSNLSINNNGNISLLNDLEIKQNWPYYGYATGFMPSYSINFLEKYQNHIIGNQDLHAKIALNRSVRLTVISQVVVSYFNILANKQQLITHQQILNDLREQKRYALASKQFGASDMLSVEDIQIKIAKFSKSIPQIQHNLYESENALRVLIGKPQANFNFKAKFSQFEDKYLVPVDIPINVLEQRPDVEEAKYLLKKDNAQVVRVMSKLIPSFKLSTIWGNGGLYFSNLFSLTTNILQGQISAMMPLIDGTIFMEIKQAKAAKSVTFYHYISTIHQALSDIDTALSRRKHLFEAYNSISIALNHANYRYKLNKNKVDLGASSYAQILPLKIEIDKLECQKIAIKQQQLNSLVSLNQALGLGA